MAKRRPMGSLENDVLACLWAADHPLVPADVLDALGDDLAYTTVTTILARLCDKGLAHRRRDGRVFRYQPAVTEDELAAQRMHAQLERTRDRSAALSQFVGTLSRRDAKALRAIIDDLDTPP